MIELGSHNLPVRDERRDHDAAGLAAKVDPLLAVEVPFTILVLVLVLDLEVSQVVPLLTLSQAHEDVWPAVRAKLHKLLDVLRLRVAATQTLCPQPQHHLVRVLGRAIHEEAGGRLELPQEQAIKILPAGLEHTLVLQSAQRELSGPRDRKSNVTRREDGELDPPSHIQTKQEEQSNEKPQWHSDTLFVAQLSMAAIPEWQSIKLSNSRKTQSKQGDRVTSKAACLSYCSPSSRRSMDLALGQGVIS